MVPPAPTDLSDSEADFRVNLEDMSKSVESFERNIKSIRDHVGKDDPRYPDFQTVKGGLGLLGLRLYWGPDHIRLAVRRSDLYIIAFRGADCWLELKETKNRQVLHSEFVGMSSSYLAWMKRADRPGVGMVLLKKAINYLPAVTKNRRNDDHTLKLIAEHMITLAMTISESVRLFHIFQFVQYSMGPKKMPTKLPDWVTPLVRNWSRLSREVRDHTGEGNDVVVGLGLEVMEPKKLDDGSIEWEQGAINTLGEVREAVKMLTWVE